jgi:plasmid maintenance system antidote protein VapI
MADEQQLEKQKVIMKDLIKEQNISIRAFARLIQEDSGDVMRWLYGKRLIIARAALTLIRMFNVKPHDIRPDLFESGVEIIFNN